MRTLPSLFPAFLGLGILIKLTFSLFILKLFGLSGLWITSGTRAKDMDSGDILNAVVALVVGAITIFVQFWLHWDARKRVSFSRSVLAFFSLFIFVVAVAVKLFWHSAVANLLFLLHLILIAKDFYRDDSPLDRKEITLFVMSVAFTLILMAS